MKRKRTHNIPHCTTRDRSVWGKGLVLILLLVLSASSLSAQNFIHRGFAFGADRDTLLYIIASPFDNWYLTLGGGIQTFMGNELEASARHNKLNYNLKAEVGKWIIPDLAVSLRVSYFDVDGQTKYGLHPFVNRAEDTPNDNGYYPFHAHSLSFVGYVTLDWTNFFCGYEIGRRNRVHVYTPIGLGFSMLHGRQRNPRDEIGMFRKNWELSYSGGIGFEYEVSQRLALSANMEIFGSESTWDWSPYDNSYSRFDIMPTLTFGARFNLLKDVRKYNPYTGNSSRETVYHEFLSFGHRHTVSDLTGRIETLNERIEQIENRAEVDSMQLADLKDSIDDLQNQLDSISELPPNVMADLIQNDLVLTVVYFELDKYDLDRNARYRLRKFAQQMDRVPDTIEYYIIGAADSLTGSKRHNDWLSEKRCQAAFDALVKDYGADRNRLTLVPAGGITAYDPKEENRMAMIVIRNEESDAIIEKWSRYKK
jgi:outer membrane protein OmpA-like peptidoglycan-associated protein